MSNRKIKECENMEFLPQEFRDNEDLSPSEKNVLATLCYFYLRFSDYVTSHDGWFFRSSKELEEESGISRASLFRVLTALYVKKLIQTKPGTNHKCTHYRLSKKITELLPKMESMEAEFEAELGGDFLGSEIANETLDKNRLEKTRLDESRKDESRIVKNSSSLETNFSGTYDDSNLPF